MKNMHFVSKHARAVIIFHLTVPGTIVANPPRLNCLQVSCKTVRSAVWAVHSKCTRLPESCTADQFRFMKQLTEKGLSSVRTCTNRIEYFSQKRSRR